MVAVQKPTDEQMYLLAILQDSSGVDIAEFALRDVRNPDGCYRLHDYQWPWFTCDDKFQIDQGGRAVGKTESIKLRCMAFPFAHAGHSMLVTAPELNHLRPLTDEIEKFLLQTRLTREIMPDTHSKGIARQPHWQVRFANGTSIISRLPNKDGRGVKGQHVLQLELDEGQDFPKAGWREVIECLNSDTEGAMFRVHGVSRGVPDEFYSRTQPNSGWTVHRPMAMMRPGWDKSERDSRIRDYGNSRQAVDYRRNVYGDHGDASNSVFVLSRLMDCVDRDEGSTYNTSVYHCIKFEYEKLPENEGARQMYLANELQFPSAHKSGYSQKVKNKEVGAPKGYTAYFAGMDVGVTNHPSEILVFGQRTGTDDMELLTRIQMHRVNTDDQKTVIHELFRFYGDKLYFGIDKTGVGFPVWDQLTRMSYGERVYGFGFSEKRVVAYEDRAVEVGETQEDLAIKRNVVEAATDWLRNDYVDLGKLRLPYDVEILTEFQGQSYTVIKDNGDPYGQRRLFSGGSLHSLDAAKMMVAARHIPQLEAMLNLVAPQEDVIDLFIGAGW